MTTCIKKPILQNKIFLFLILIIYIFNPIEVQSQLLLKIKHEDWAEKEYANPHEYDPVTLANKALHIIDYDLQEPVAQAWLEETSCYIPEVNEYLSFMSAQETDTLGLHKRRVLKAIEKFAENNAPGSDFHLWSMFLSLLGESEITFSAEDWEQLIGQVTKEVEKVPNPERKAILAIIKMAYLNKKINSESNLEETDYQQVFDLEEEGLDAYPLDSPENTMIRAILYYMLASIKSGHPDDFLDWIYNRETATEYRPYCRFIGQYGYFPSNAEDYYNRALEIATNVLNEGHPCVRIIANELNFFKKNTSGLSANIYERLKQDYQYLSYYWPSNINKLKELKIVYILDSLSLGLNLEEEKSLPYLLDSYQAYLGEKNPEYLKIILNIGLSMVTMGIEPDYWQQRIQETLLTNDVPMKSEILMEFMLPFAINNYKNQEDEFMSTILDVEKIYSKNHQPTLKSAEIGRQLAWFYSERLKQNKKGSELMEIAFRDLQKSLTKPYEHHPQWWRYKIEKGTLENQEKGNQANDDYYRDLFDLSQKIDNQYGDKIRFFILKNWINFRINTTLDYKGALQLIDLLPAYGRNAQPFYEFPYHAMKGFLLVQTSKNINNDFIKSELNKAWETLLDACEKEERHRIELSDITYIVLAWGRMDELEKSLETANLQYKFYCEDFGDEFSPFLFDIALTRANIHKNLNQRNEAHRIMADVINKMKTVPELEASTFLLDCLWEDYYMAKADNIDDAGSLLYRFYDIKNCTEALTNNKDTDRNVAVVYGSRLMIELTTLAVYLQNEFNAHKDSMTPEELELYPKIIKAAQFDQIPEYSNNLMALFRKTIPDYKSNYLMHYLMLTYGEYLDVVMDNQREAGALYNALLNNYDVDDKTKLDVLSRLAGMEFRNGDINKWGKYLLEIDSLVSSLTYLEDNYYLSLDNSIASYYSLTGQSEKALPYARDFFTRNKKVLDGNFQLMTSNDQKNYMEAHGDPALVLCGLLIDLPEEILGEVYDAVIYRTGMQLRSQRETRNAITRHNDPEILSKLDTIAFLQKQMQDITTYVNNPSNTNFEEFYQQDPNTNLTLGQQKWIEYGELLRACEKLEMEVLDATLKYRENTIESVTWQQICNKLKDNEAAIEFVFSNNHIMALLLKKEIERPLAVELCEIKELQSLLDAKGKNSSAALAQSLYPSESAVLYNLLWAPLDGNLEGVRKIYYTLPGILNNLAFNAFMDNEGNLLFDRYDLNQLTTTGQIMFDSEPRQLETITILGNIYYKNNPDPISVSEAKMRNIDDDYLLVEDPDQRGLKKDYFRSLPFTRHEINGVASLFPKNKVDSVQTFKATESRFREMIKSSPDILHLATHGFFITSDKDPKKIPYFEKRGSSSMVRSGFALAGAEETWRGRSNRPDDDDGIMTAEEVSMLDLSKTSLVALSACETALGDYSYEGIYGLQRGFKQAGVKSLLVSLWSVNDESTALFMTSFYEALKEGNSKQKAWRTAVEDVRQKYHQPYFWAPFILLDANE